LGVNDEFNINIDGKGLTLQMKVESIDGSKDEL
jgi:hypothetical protein